MLERATSTIGRVIALVVVLVGGGVTAAVTGDAPLDRRPAGPGPQPVLVPVEVPEGYELWPTPALSTPAGDPGATWVYRPVDPSAPVVSVCIVADDVSDGEHSCVPDGHEAIVSYDSGDFRTFIVPLGPGGAQLEHDPWHDLDLTASWGDVEWIDG